MRYDIALNEGDLYIKNDDFIFTESDTQHVIDTMNAFAGWWKENPLDGVGLMAYMKGNTNTQELNRKISIELQADGYKTSSPVVTLSPDGKLIINPNVEPI